MPKFIVTNSSYFQPFTYDELAKPVAQAAEIHRATQDAYDQIGTEAEALRRYIEQEPEDSNARMMYDSYMDKLSTLQNNLWSNGYNAQTRRDLAAARAGYASDITRLGTAIKNRQDRSTEYNTYKRNNPDAIMSDDPGFASLDEYLANDLYGQDFYSYSGRQLAQDVAEDLKARGRELANDPEIMNMNIPGYIFLKQNNGFTSEQIDAANRAVQAYWQGEGENAIANLDPITRIAANVINSHVTSTGASSRVSAKEFERLLGWSSYGANQAINDPKIEHLADKAWEHAMDRYDAAYKHSLTNPKPANGGFQMPDARVDTIVGSKNERARNKFGRQTGMRAWGKDKEDDPRFVKDVNGNAAVVSNSVNASQLVYDEDFVNQMRDILGFSIAENTDTNGIWFNTQRSFLHGQAYGDDGNLYDTRYNNKTNTVQTRRAGTHEKFADDENLTDLYNRARKHWEDNVNYYKEHQKEVYDMAKVNPDKQKRIYNRENIPSGTPLDEAADVMLNQSPRTSIEEKPEFYVARSGQDGGKYVETISDFISNAIPKNSSGSPRRTKTSEWRGYNGTAMGIHEIDKDGVLKRKVERPNDIFKYDDTNKITNISSITVDPAAIQNGYIICRLSTASDDNVSYAIGLDMLNSAAIESVFEVARKEMKRARLDPYLSKEAKERAPYIQAAKAAMAINGVLYNGDTVGRTNTSTTNPYMQ